MKGSITAFPKVSISHCKEEKESPWTPPGMVTPLPPEQKDCFFLEEIIPNIQPEPPQKKMMSLPLILSLIPVEADPHSATTSLQVAVESDEVSRLNYSFLNHFS